MRAQIETTGRGTSWGGEPAVGFGLSEVRIAVVMRNA